MTAFSASVNALHIHSSMTTGRGLVALGGLERRKPFGALPVCHLFLEFRE
jgi:hypothetical protein